VRLGALELGRAVEASCAGWATPGVVHTRRFEVSEREARIVDRVDGRALPVEASLPLAPGVEVALDGLRAGLRLPSGTRVALELPGGLAWRLERAPYFPAFGREEVRPILRGHAASWRGGVWVFSSGTELSV
jgi:hypothetical protein